MLSCPRRRLRVNDQPDESTTRINAIANIAGPSTRPPDRVAASGPARLQ
jgi:hypothetical protein